MKRAEQLAWAAVAGLLVAALILFAGAFAYRVTVFWAGALLVTGQAAIMGLAAWGLSLSRQARELNELPGTRLSGMPKQDTGGGFRMSMGGDELAARPGPDAPTEEVKLLDVGFQRLLVGLAGGVQTVLAILMGYGVYFVYAWAQRNPDAKLPVAGVLGAKVPQVMDELSLLIGLSAAGIYAALYWFTRPTREMGPHGDAASSNFTLGLTGMAGLGVASLLGYLKVAWASEMAAGVIVAFMLLQGLELIVNACRSYSSIEELDQEAIDLQATPLVPMLASVWLGGLRILIAQSLGLSGEDRKGGPSVMARMMPRVLIALLLVAVAVSCIRVVPPGQVAVLERLGYAPSDADGRPMESAILQPGLHFTFPWPIDELTYLPTVQLQLTDIGTELHATGDWKNVDFQFWMIRPPGSEKNESDDLFVTGDPGSPQFLETYIQVRWRVADPARFYATMSHSEFVDKPASGDARTLPIYEAMVQQATAFAVTRTFAIHTMDQILITDRAEVEQHCRDILQEKLDELCQLPAEAAEEQRTKIVKPGSTHRGIEVAYLTIKDLHPPYWKADRPDSSKPAIGGVLVERNGRYEVVSDPSQPTTIARGPASAFELVVSMREFEQEIINRAQQKSIAAINDAHGKAQSMIADARTYSSQKIAEAHGEADRFVEMTRGMSPSDLDLMKRRLMFDAARDLFNPVTKIIVDPQVRDVQVIQNSDKSGSTFRPPAN